MPRIIPRILDPNLRNPSMSPPSRISASYFRKTIQGELRETDTMTNADSNPTNLLVTNLAFGLLGAGLVYYGRRNQGVLAYISTTAGYGLIAKIVSSTVIAALKATED